jgi:hypothetical protein
MANQAKGLYQRNGIWWFRFTHQKQQHFLPLKTRDLDEALLEAKKIKEDPERLHAVLL